MTGAQLQAELQKQAEHSRAQEALLNESMQQLAVARQLLCDLSVEGERQMLMVAEEQIERLQQLFTAKAAEVRRSLALPVVTYLAAVRARSPGSGTVH